MTIEWLSPEAAVARVQDARGRGVRLLGFDGAYLDLDGVRPSLADSWDYAKGGSWPSVRDPYAHAIQFIRDRAASGLSFEIVLDE